MIQKEETLSYAAPAIERCPSYPRWRWQIFVITWLAYAGFYLTRKSFAVAKIGISHDPQMHMSDAQMAWIDMGYGAACAIGQAVFGMAGDRLGTRRIVLAGMFVSVVTAMVVGASSLTIFFGLLLFVQGLAQSTGWAPLSKNMSNFFSRRERGKVMGFWCTNYPVGGLIALLLAGYAGDRFGWQYAFYVPAIAFTIVLVLFALFQRNRPEDVGLPSIEEYHGEPAAVLKVGESPAEEPEGSWKVIREVLTNRMVIILALVYFLLKPARYALLNWGPKYMNARLHGGMADAGLVSSMFELGGAPGAILAGYISDKYLGSRRMPICVVCLVLLGVALVFLDRVTASRMLLGGSLFLIGLLLFAADSMIVGTSAMDFGTKKGASTAAGLINAIGSIGLTLGGSLPGFMNRKWGWGGVFGLLGGMAILAGLILLPQWNAQPAGIKRSAGAERSADTKR